MYKSGDVIRCTAEKSKHFGKTFLIVGFVTYADKTYATTCDLTSQFGQYLTHEEILNSLITDLDIESTVLENPDYFELVTE